MNYLRQFSTIILISMAGEALKALLPLPIPASIYGLLLMFLGLCLRVIPLKSVEGAGIFLVEIMPVLFIPAGVGLLTSWDELRPVFLPTAVITLVSTVAVMAASGRSTQFVIQRDRKKAAGHE